MDLEQRKASGFIIKLLANTALQDLTPLHKEEQIIQFLEANANQLYPTLSSQDFFPEKNWTQIQSLLYKALMENINQILFSYLEKMLGKIDFGFISFLNEQEQQQQHQLDVSGAQKTLLDFQKNILNKIDARQAFIGPYTAVQLNLTDRYIEESFWRREYIYFELVKVQKLKMSKEEIKNLVKVSLLLKNGIHLLTVSEARHGAVLGIVQSSFVEKVCNALRKQLEIMPEALLRSGLNSNISFLENQKMETTSRMASIFASRCQNYKPFKKVDRGADTPDKSWFNIARRNYKYYGFDIKMLDELYKIAGENGW